MKRFWIINLVLFQASWFSAAFLTVNANIILAALLGVHFLLSPSAKKDLAVLPLALIGIAVDIFHFNIGSFSSQLGGFPLWLALLWSLFVISFNHSLSWLVNKPIWLLMAFGAVGGTSSYWAGMQAGALQSGLQDATLIASLALSWGLLFPLLIVSYRTFSTFLSSRGVLNTEYCKMNHSKNNHS